jgi:hypothetical protein
VYVIVDAHAATLQALVIKDSTSTPQRLATSAAEAQTRALARVQAFVDSVRVQPQGTPQRSTLRYRADTVMVATGDTLAATHVSATTDRRSVNPAWYLIHIKSGSVQPVDSLIGDATGLPPSAGGWDNNGRFYYAKELAIWRAQVNAR